MKHLTKHGPQAIENNLALTGNIATGYKEVSTDYTVLSSDSTINCLSPIIVTLPTATGITGKHLVVKNSSTGSVVVSANDSQLIDGGNTAALGSQWSSISLQATSASSWIII